jgi:hypothetical protein
VGVRAGADSAKLKTTLARVKFLVAQHAIVIAIELFEGGARALSGTRE